MGDVPRDLAPPPGDGECFSSGDLSSGCPTPGGGTCVDVVACWNSCIGDPTCESMCYGNAKNAQSRDDAQGYIECRAAAFGPSGACAASCQNSPGFDEPRCLDCLHVCAYDAQCRYGCTCGVCAAQLAACYRDL
jgi:hypothetical protein